MAPEAGFVAPGWSLPAGVRCCLTNRRGGFSLAPFCGFNLGDHVGDALGPVRQNRLRLQTVLRLDNPPVWLSQVHGRRIYLADEYMKQAASGNIEADASYTTRPQNCLAVLVADCLPVLICSADGLEIAAVHAGWRGLASGIIRRAVETFVSDKLLLWLGPCIGPCHYEVDDALRDQFSSSQAFSPAVRPGHWMFDLRAEARRQLKTLGLDAVTESAVCTYCDEDYYSFRRDGQSGRFAALIWRHVPHLPSRY